MATDSDWLSRRHHRRIARLVFVGSMCGSTTVIAATDDPALSRRVPVEPIYGGTEVASCGWPTTVSLGASCTGTLVHPELVIYAAHCGTHFGSVRFGESVQGGPGRDVPTQYCRAHPGGDANLGAGTDIAFCKLAQPQTDITIVPILMGCETDVLAPGREVVVVGFGQADNGPYGIKREVTTTINSVGAEASIGGGGKDSCQGDSGGPVYVRLSGIPGADDTWRVFGITSYGGACGGGGMYSMMHRGIEWFESESGIDLTPCHDSSGNWDPGPDCGQFPLDPQSGGGAWANGCSAGPLGGYSQACGPGFNAEPDIDPPVVAVVSPADGSRVDSDPASGLARVDVVVSADDGDGWGVQQVELLIDGVAIPNGVRTEAPYDFEASFPPGIYEVSARATDRAGNSAVADAVSFGVDVDPDPVEPDPSGEPDATEGEEGGEGRTSGDDETTWQPDGVGASQDEEGEGCACATTGRPGHPHALLGLLMIAGSLTRRRCME
jgi:MYXO-CTERM domain-containing protein